MNASALGMELVPLAPKLRSELHVPKDVSGVVVGRIAPDSPARALGIQSGDVILSIDQKPAATPQEAAAELKEDLALLQATAQAQGKAQATADETTEAAE